jgi:hypothetical protein
MSKDIGDLFDQDVVDSFDRDVDSSCQDVVGSFDPDVVGLFDPDWLSHHHRHLLARSHFGNALHIFQPGIRKWCRSPGR